MPSSKKQLQARMSKLLEETEFTVKDIMSANLTFFNYETLKYIAENIQIIDTTGYSTRCEDAIEFLQEIKSLLKQEEQRRKYENELQRLEQKESRKEERRQKERAEEEILNIKRRKPYLLSVKDS